MTDTPHPRRDDPWAELIAPLRPILPQSRETWLALAVLLVLAVWGLAILTFGIPALVWPMKLIVPAAVAGLVLLTWGM